MPPLFLLPSRYELTMAAITVLSILAIEFRTGSGEKRISRLAMFSCCWGLLNPTLVFIAFRRLGLPWIALGDSELRAWFAGTLALVAGIIALKRIKRSEGHVRGRLFAWLGILSGGIWSICWLFAGLGILLLGLGRRGG